MTRRSVLLGWELGGGLSHVRRLLAVGHGLAAAGLEPVLALKDPGLWAGLGVRPSYRVVAAPKAPSPALPWFRAASYADILAVRGYTNLDDLAIGVCGWDRILADVKPALVVSDHSPTLCLAAAGKVPTVVIGNGFTVPPAQEVWFPRLDDDAEPLVAQEHVFRVVRQVSRLRGRRPPDALPAAFAGDARLVAAIAELDPYHSVRRDPLIGPLEPLASASPPPDSPRLFAYLAAGYAGLDLLFLALGKRGIPTRLFLQGADASLRNEAVQAGLRVDREPPPLKHVLPACAIVLHHGGQATAVQALAAARPQVVLPRCLEQELTGHAIEAMGCGVSLAGPQSVAAVIEAMERMLADSSYAARSARFADAIHAREPLGGVDAVVDRCIALAHGARTRAAPFSSLWSCLYVGDHRHVQTAIS